MHGDAGSRYQAVEVRRRRVRSAVLSPDASRSPMLFHETVQTVVSSHSNFCGPDYVSFPFFPGGSAS